jgi:hypothetical protein
MHGIAEQGEDVHDVLLVGLKEAVFARVRTESQL